MTYNYETKHVGATARVDISVLNRARMRDPPRWRETTNILRCGGWSERTKTYELQRL